MPYISGCLPQQKGLRYDLSKNKEKKKGDQDAYLFWRWPVSSCQVKPKICKIFTFQLKCEQGVLLIF